MKSHHPKNRRRKKTNPVSKVGPHANKRGMKQKPRSANSQKETLHKTRERPSPGSANPPQPKRFKSDPSDDVQIIGQSIPAESGEWPFPYNPVNSAWQMGACQVLNLHFIKSNKTTAGSPATVLRKPALHTLQNTTGDGNCLFRAFPY